MSLPVLSLSLALPSDSVACTTEGVEEIGGVRMCSVSADSVRLRRNVLFILASFSFLIGV